MKELIANFLDLDIEEIKEITKDQEKALRESTHNLWQMPEFYTDDHLIFTNEGAMKHWRYYAGFEYLPDPEILKRNGNFIAAYSEDSDDRIREYLNILQESEVNPTESK